jgi:hypothetical protein
MKLRCCPSIILLYTVASGEQHLRPHASGCIPAILKNEGMPEGPFINLTMDVYILVSFSGELARFRLSPFRKSADHHQSHGDAVYKWCGKLLKTYSKNRRNVARPDDSGEMAGGEDAVQRRPVIPTAEDVDWSGALVSDWRGSTYRCVLCQPAITKAKNSKNSGQ